jgi:signal transduction histidine kinase
MQLRALSKTTTFRLSMLYGLLFAVGLIALLGVVYLKSVVYLGNRVDSILATEADALVQSPRPGLRERLVEELTLNGNTRNIFALFSPAGTHIAGNLDAMPSELSPDGPPVEVPPTEQFPAYARVIARRLPGGDVLVVGRDVHQLREMRSIISSALLWSGAMIIVVGLACAVVLSLAPLRRLRDLQSASGQIAQGNMRQRMPIGKRGDELDMLASTVNAMMDEVERLMLDVKGSADAIAHDLLSPLTRVSIQLRRIVELGIVEPAKIASVNAEVDQVLDRFRAILRVAQLEAHDRKAGFDRVDLADVLDPVGELYQPLAEASEVKLLASVARGTTVQADRKLLFEAVCNLVDNAIKFVGRGGTVQLRLEEDGSESRIIVQDNGPGIPASERSAGLQRFYRGRNSPLVTGSGIGLSLVNAIVRLHGFDLVLEDAQPGLRVFIRCHRNN